MDKLNRDKNISKVIDLCNILILLNILQLSDSFEIFLFLFPHTFLFLNRKNQRFSLFKKASQQSEKNSKEFWLTNNWHDMKSNLKGRKILTISLLFLPFSYNFYYTIY